LGMHIGDNVFLPASTWVDESYCFLISIGDNCGFGEGCAILAHDAQMNELLGVTLVGHVIIRASCHIGARTVILPGVEIGPRTLVGANSVVTHSLPPDTVCAGAPARVICSLDEYLDRHRARLPKAPVFSFERFRDPARVSPEDRARLLEALRDGPGYVGDVSDEPS
ncbi:MAG TPA: acyltransferase, partial [Methylomirabilota bacterium]|nr:acyltransferase [Methylomirabilota bacterium]